LEVIYFVQDRGAPSEMTAPDEGLVVMSRTLNPQFVDIAREVRQ
jgi:hypothetical protein